MKISLTILILGVAGLISCNKINPFLQLTANLVSVVKSYDLDNTGSSSDIRVDFEIKDNLNVTEYRIMVIPSSFSNSFKENNAASISEVSYIRVVPESFKVKYSINRLPSGLLDVNGVQIQNDIEYVVVVFVMGTGNRQLSDYTAPFTLLNQGIYSGRYILDEEKSCVNPVENVGITVPGNATENVFVDFTETGNEYTGVIECPECEDDHLLGIVCFSAIGTSISNYIFGNVNNLCTDPTWCDVGNPCLFIEQGEGSVKDELIIEVDFTNVGCYWVCEGKRFFIRQG